MLGLVILCRSWFGWALFFRFHALLGHVLCLCLGLCRSVRVRACVSMLCRNRSVRLNRRGFLVAEQWLRLFFQD